MAWTLDQLASLEAAIASGTRSVNYDGKSVTYSDLDTMLRIRGMLQRALGVTPAASATVFASHDRGFPGGDDYGDLTDLYTGW